MSVRNRSQVSVVIVCKGKTGICNRSYSKQIVRIYLNDDIRKSIFLEKAVKTHENSVKTNN